MAVVIGLLTGGSDLLSPARTAAGSQTGGLPDLIVRGDILGRDMVVRTEDLPPCDVQEAGITGGPTHTILRFTVSTANFGTADLNLGDPNAHIAVHDGLYEYATCHHHFHFRHYTEYDLIDPATGHVWRSAKRGFCMRDTDPAPASLVPAPPGPARYRVCGAPGVPGNQGLSVGWQDTYLFSISGQYFVLDGGEGQPPVPPGKYLLRVTVNPGFVPAPGEPCRYADPNHPGVCHELPESNYDNNVAQITITIHCWRQVARKTCG
jgi:hypothetical protein